MTGPRLAANASERSSRRAMSLLEVVLAAAILAGSLAVLGQYLNAARVASAKAASETEALMLAESLMDDAVATLSAGETAPDLSEQSGVWRSERTVVAIEDGPLHRVSVTVAKSNAAGDRVAAASLGRFVLLAEVE